MATPVKLPGSPPARRIQQQQYGFLWWRIVQVVFFVIVILILIRNDKPCTSLQPNQPSAQGDSTKTTTKSQSNNNNNNNNKVEQYTRPLSARVPAAGIETILATSATQPPFHFFAHSTKNDWLTAQIVKTGLYEKDSTTALIDAIVCDYHNGKPLLVTDLGANIGFHSLHMASCGARVVSFEASPDTAWLLQSSAKLNGMLRDVPSVEEQGTLTLIPRGVSNTTATARLSRHHNSPGMTSFVKKTSFDLKAGEKGTALDVDIPLVRAQDVLEALEVTRDRYELRFLKMDVEGFEYQALQGLDLQKYPFEYLTLEFFPSLLQAGGTNPAELLVYIWKQGYRYLEFDANKKLADYTKVHTGDTEATVRAWAQNMVKVGYEQKKKGYHVNLLAQRQSQQQQATKS